MLSLQILIYLTGFTCYDSAKFNFLPNYYDDYTLYKVLYIVFIQSDYFITLTANLSYADKVLVHMQEKGP